MTSTRKITRRLAAARDEHEFVLLDRTEGGYDQGIVVALGEQWLLIAVAVDGGYFNGFTAVRIDDISGVRPDVTFEARALRLRPEWPPLPPAAGIDLDSTAGVLRTPVARDTLVSLERSSDHSASWIGAVADITTKWLWFTEVLSDATWRSRTTGLKLAKVTAVSVGGRYLAGLSEIAGSPPPAQAD
jgi:hypothetical protein